MGRIIGIVLVVVAIYFAANTYLGQGPDGEQGPSTAQRAGSRVQEAYDEGAARREALLPD
ncbi:MAG: hypothetical protein JRI23_11665 [Deltaproteobacteria bacterium]|jgi:hypothetical protein|nr:hypothetical protein [Deltaproteobacteria bacterium]